MVKFNFGQVELEIDDYRNFLLGGNKGGYIYPACKNKVYLISELTDFFEVAQKELEKLLSQIIPNGKSIEVSENENLSIEFHLLGHGKTGTNAKGLLTGWSGDMPCHTYIMGEEIELGGIELALGQAGIMPKDKTSEDLLITQGVERIDINSYYARFVGDLPRQIGHGLYLTGETGIIEELNEISHRINQEISNKGNLYDVSIYHKLMNLAIENGFIPTPLLRAQYYGPMELHKETLKSKEKSEFIEGIIKETEQRFINAGLENKFDRKKVEEEAEDIAGALIERGNLLYSRRDESGHYITENRFNLVNRLKQFYETVMRFAEGKKILVTTSSGCIDVSPALFRYLENPTKINIEKPKQKVRGQVAIVKFGEFDGKVCYLNDQKKIDALREANVSKAKALRKVSLDDKIRASETGAIIPVELLGFRRERQAETDKYEQYRVSVDDLLFPSKINEPALFLGNFGQGKSTAAIELTDKLNTDRKYIAILVNARDINTGLHNALGEDTKQNDQIILDLLSAGVPSLPKSLRDEYQFVFIIDALDEVVNYRENILHFIRDTDHLGKYGKVIVTSRFSGFGQYENPGFQTFHLDPEAVLRNLDTYLKSRIADESKRMDFKEFLMRQDEGVKTNYLLVYFLTDMYKKRPNELGGLKETLSEGQILIKGIEVGLWDQKLTKDSTLPQTPKPYEGQSEEEYQAALGSYESARSMYLEPWMDFLSKVAAYMTVHDKRTITRQEIEEIASGWTLSGFSQELKGR